MADWSAVDCAEEFGTRRESFSLGPFSGAVTLRCAWADRYNLVDDLLYVGRAWPEFSSWDNPPLAQTAVIRPGNSKSGTGMPDGQEMIYDDVLVDVTYGMDQSVDKVAESIESAAQFQLLDYNKFNWGSGSGPALTEQEAPGRLLRGLVLSRTIYQMSAVPVAVLQAGAVNNAPYTSSLLGITFPTETMMLAPASVSRTIRTDGSTPFTVSLKFIVEPNGWNKVFRASTMAWDKIYLKGGAEFKSYPPADLSALLF